MMPQRRGRGLGIVELLVALALMVTALFTLITVFSRSSRYAVMSRNRTVAILVCHSTMDELKAHKFGTPPPKSWSEPISPVTIYADGRPQSMDFKRTITYGDAFVGKANGNADEATITVEWDEGIGSNNGHKTMTVKVPVWR